MKNYTHISMRERCTITTLLEMGWSKSSIANHLGRHRSTIYRELSKNHTNGYYRPGKAHAKAQSRRPRKQSKLTIDKALYHYVYDRLKMGWSPEQIVGRMRLENQSFNICCETIYRYIYKPGIHLSKYLPSKRKKRRIQRYRHTTQCKYGDIRHITNRPTYIDKRKHIGHWEGDLICFSGTRSNTVTTLVERTSRMVSLIKNPTKTSNVVMRGIANKFIDASNLLCKTITFDQGSEFANYKDVESAINCKIFYCSVRAPWQKGSNENMNGRLRRYLPRNTDIIQVSQKNLDQISVRMNNTPRKCLGYRTPKELYFKHSIKQCRTRM